MVHISNLGYRKAEQQDHKFKDSSASLLSQDKYLLQDWGSCSVFPMFNLRAVWGESVSAQVHYRELERVLRRSKRKLYGYSVGCDL